MGVPKFYRWLSERFPKINQLIDQQGSFYISDAVDSLYIDANGIIHGCTHPPHMDISETLTEKDMMLGIMQYLDRIITQIVKPKVSVFIAIDGVAPRAKLNQQRSRRFRSAKDMAEATKDLPKDQLTGKANVFDSNSITPGTEFLAKVSEVIKFWIRKKIKEDPLWQRLTVIFSGHDVPGEGEHKIMEHIRSLRAQPNYQPNYRHCIYGQDADLIMLGLVTHEPHFVILREVINFNFNFRDQNTLKQVKKFTKESDFQLLHLSILREYLALEFCEDGKYDLERCIDDFVFMTFLVGNDFLPHMPTLDIGDGAFDLLWDIYKTQRVDWGPGEYLTKNGEISDPQRLEIFLHAIGQVESDILEQKEKDDAAYIKKKRKWNKRDGKDEGPSDAELKAKEDSKQSNYIEMLTDLMAKHSISDYVDGWTPPDGSEKKDFKGRYYFEKMSMTPVDKDAHWALRKSYMEGLIWCLAYYYKGCISWDWFYPYHYGPMLSDLMELPKMFKEIKFEMGEPLLPFQQLMACLPPASEDLIPKLYRWLMTSFESPIIKFYPQEFEVDMNGKKNPWEGVNLLPFIDVKLLKSTIAEHCPASKLSAQERQRNAFGGAFGYKHDVSCTDRVECPSKGIGVADIPASHSSVFPIDIKDCGVPFEAKLIPGTQIPYPGFPSLHVIPIAKHELVAIGLNCFGSPSKYQTRLLSLHSMPELPPIEVLAESILGKALYVNWPSMHEGKAVAICDGDKEVRLVKDKPKVVELSKIDKERWQVETTEMVQMYYVGNGSPGAGGINIGDVAIRLKLLPLQGMRTILSTGATKKVYGTREADVPLQLALWQSPAPDPRFIERGPMTVEDRFPKESRVVLTKGKYRGCSGKVVGIADSKNLAVEVNVIPSEIPFGISIAQSVQEAYLSSYEAAKTLKMNPGLFGKIMGRLQFAQGKYDLGLNLKSADGMCVIGYTRKKVENDKGQTKSQEPNAWAAGDSVTVIGSSKAKDDDPDERIQWEYTPKAIRLVGEYRQKFPQLFSALAKNPNERKYDAIEVFGPNGEAFLPVIRDWLNKHPTATLPRTPVSTQSMSYEAIAAVQKAADVRSLALTKKGYPKVTTIKVPGSALYREASTGAADILSAADLNGGSSPVLGDRIVNLCAEGIPFGARGTVVGIHEAETTGSVEVVMDEEFIGGTSLQGACSNYRGKLCLWAHVLRVTPEGSVSKAPRDVNKIIATLQKDIPNPSPEKKDSSSEAQLKQILGVKVTSNSSANPSPPEGRSASTGRTKTTYRESKGPAKKGNGFNTKRSSKNGLESWKKAVDGSRNDGAANHLKSLLGVGAQRQSISSPPPKSNADGGASELKAMLGVTPSPSTSTSVSAADKLMAMMSQKPMQSQHPQAQMPSGFNFTYVEEGKEASPPLAVSSVQMPVSYGPPPMAYGGPMYPPPYGGGFVPPNPTSGNMMANQDFPPLGGNQPDFPPLNGSANQASPQKDKQSTASSPAMMIPANVAGKSKKK